MPTPPPPDLANLLSIGRQRPMIRQIETPVYGHFQESLQQWLNKSQFLSIKYGMIDDEQTLTRLAELQENWDTYGASPPNANAIQASREALANLAANQILPTAIVASAEGGISIYFMGDGRTAYIESDNEGTQTLVLYGQQTPTEVLEVDVDIPKADVGARLLGYLG